MKYFQEYLSLSTAWFEKNLIMSELGIKYLKKVHFLNSTINDFKIGYSYNPKTSLYNYLKD